MNPKKLKGFLIVVIVISAIGAILIIFRSFNYFSREKKEVNVQNQNAQINEVKEFRIQATRFNYGPDVIRAKRGEKIKLTIDNIDTLHGIRIPDLGISGNESLEFVVDKLGEFNWYCNNYCGGAHSQMQGKLIIE